MPIQKCPLCLETKNVVSSHLMPRRLYDYCRKGKHRPVKYGDGFLLPTDRQTQDYLLCEDCEDVLNQGGESWIVDKLATWERAFPFYDVLTKLPADFHEDGMQLYFGAKNSELETDKITHFALGLFWKASVHSWKGDTIEPRIKLGPYSEEIRRFLIGEGVFPKNVYLVTVVERPVRAQVTLNDPYEAEGEEWHSFFAHVPGLYFMLATGKLVDESTRALCIHNSPGNPIVISEQFTDKYVQMMAETVRGARKTNALLRAQEKIAEERKKESL